MGDYAGHSPQLVLLRVPTSSRTARFFPSLSKNLLIATTTAQLAAMEVPWRAPSSGMRLTRPNSRMTTHTLARTEPAKSPHTPDKSTPLATRLSLRNPHLHSWPPLRLAQHLSLSRLTRWPSRCTRMVFSTPPNAEPNSTTVSSPSATEPRMAKTTTSLRTPGAPPGVTRDTSRSPTTEMVTVSAVSSSAPSAQPCE